MDNNAAPTTHVHMKDCIPALENGNGFTNADRERAGKDPVPVHRPKLPSRSAIIREERAAYNQRIDQWEQSETVREDDRRYQTWRRRPASQVGGQPPQGASASVHQTPAGHFRQEAGRRSESPAMRGGRPPSAGPSQREPIVTGQTPDIDEIDWTGFDEYFRQDLTPARSAINDLTPIVQNVFGLSWQNLDTIDRRVENLRQTMQTQSALEVYVNNPQQQAYLYIQRLRNCERLYGQMANLARQVQAQQDMQGRPDYDYVGMVQRLNGMANFFHQSVQYLPQWLRDSCSSGTRQWVDIFRNGLAQQEAQWQAHEQEQLHRQQMAQMQAQQQQRQPTRSHRSGTSEHYGATPRPRSESPFQGSEELYEDGNTPRRRTPSRAPPGPGAPPGGRPPGYYRPDDRRYG